MGGFFGGAPSAPPPPSSPAPAPVVQPGVADADEVARKQRLDNMARNRRGRAGMIATSDRGVLDSAGSGGKSLLGE